MVVRTGCGTIRPSEFSGGQLRIRGSVTDADTAGSFVKAMDDHIALAQRVREELGMSFRRMRDVWNHCISNGGKILFFGNGGSADQAQHFAAELVVKLKVERTAIPAMALTTDTSIITAAGNDFGFEHIFSRQIEALGRPGDVALALSTSGRSPNVIRALKVANDRGLVTAGLTGGDGGEVTKIARHVMVIPDRDTGRIQEMHLVIGHLLCAELERSVMRD